MIKLFIYEYEIVYVLTVIMEVYEMKELIKQKPNSKLRKSLEG
ncbi:hypothetical protein YN1HA_20170 [Sulfurisphaera ohwakuensis]